MKVDVDANVTQKSGPSSFLVDLTESASSSPTDVGTVTIELLASDGTTVVASTTATAASGYAYRLPKVPRGTYFLRAGTDSNQNGVLGESGEFLGEYPKVTAPATLELDGLNDFEIDFVVKLQ
jgi:hypothetical protein